ncbi:MAG: hypothetical protein V3U24_09210, partial [Candidatus Neomarinimicrobiota bacterium]
MKTGLTWFDLGLTLLVGDSNLEENGEEIIRIGRDIIVKRGETVDNAGAIGGDVTVYGEVEDNVVSVGGSVYLGPDAYIRGDVVSVGGEIEKTSGAEVKGDLVEVSFWGFPFGRKSHFWSGWWVGSWFLRLLSLIGSLAVTVLIVALIPNTIDNFSSMVEDNAGQSILWGFLGIVLIVPVAVVLCLSLVGILLLPVEFLIVCLTTVVGYISVARFLGRKTTKSLNMSTQPILLEATFGVLLLWIIGLIPVLGWLTKLLVALVGFGAGIAVFVAKRKKTQEVKTEALKKSG